EVTAPSPFQAALREGRQAKDVARALLEEVGFTSLSDDVKIRGAGLEVTFTALDRSGGTWAFEVVGSFTTNRSGLRRADALWRTLGRSAVIHEARPELPLVVITTDAPTKGTPGHRSLTAL